MLICLIQVFAIVHNIAALPARQVASHAASAHEQSFVCTFIIVPISKYVIFVKC